MIIAIPTNNTGHNAEVPSRTQNAAYSRYVSNAGLTPVLVPMEADAEIIADMADGLLLAGGIDIDPMYYGYANHASHGVDPAKDDAERKLLHAFKARGKKVFGICRGMQLIFREYLHAVEGQDDGLYFDYLENIGGHGQTGSLSVRRSIPSHYVRTDMPNLFNANIEPAIQNLPVNSMHHQACVFNHGLLHVDTYNLDQKGVKPPENFVASEPMVTKVGPMRVLSWSLRSVQAPKTANKYGDYWSIIEAFRIDNWDGNNNLMGVQWHPEELNTVELLANFFVDQEDADLPLEIGKAK